MKGMNNMATYEYETKQGIRYGCRGYLGLDDLTGKQVNVDKRGFYTEKEAELFFTREKLKFLEGERKKREKLFTYEEVYLEWLEIYKNTVKESTLVKTEERFRLHILPAFGDMLIKKITPAYIQQVLNEWHGSYKKYKYMYNNFKRVMNYALLHEYIISNPCEKVSLPTRHDGFVQEKKTKDFYDKEELYQFLTILKEHEPLKWYAMFRLLAFSGIRRGELLALTWNDINFTEKTLSINKSLSQGENNRLIVLSPKTKAGIRTIGLDDETLSVLKEWRHEQATKLLALGFNSFSYDQLAFSNTRNNSHLNLGAPRNALARICKKHKLEMINIHGFRHTHCSLLFEAGVPVKDVKERLGHSDIQTTMNIYTHVTPTSRKESAEKFARYVNF